MQRLLVLTGIVAFAFIAFAYVSDAEETTCESHRRNSQSSAHGMKWNIRCDNEGFYEELQCTDDANEKKRWCACYNKEEAITQPSMKTRTCVCPKAREQNANIVCANTGKFTPRQCDGEMCHCVNIETGEKTNEPVRNRNLEC